MVDHRCRRRRSWWIQSDLKRVLNVDVSSLLRAKQDTVDWRIGQERVVGASAIAGLPVGYGQHSAYLSNLHHCFATSFGQGVQKCLRLVADGCVSEAMQEESVSKWPLCCDTSSASLRAHRLMLLPIPEDEWLSRTTGDSFEVLRVVVELDGPALDDIANFVVAARLLQSFVPAM